MHVKIYEKKVTPVLKREVSSIIVMSFDSSTKKYKFIRKSALFQVSKYTYLFFHLTLLKLVIHRHVHIVKSTQHHLPIFVHGSIQDIIEHYRNAIF